MDPYRVLGVDQNATDDEIKTAYRRLVKKYHPDRYTHDSAQQAAAAEELKKINAAYDAIIKMRQGHYETGGTAQFAEVRAAIQRGAIGEAEALLRQMPNKNAEWHYLMGIVMRRRGWYDSAFEHFTMAYRMDPTNPEYESAIRAMANSAGTYVNFGEDDMPRGRGFIPYSMCCCLSSALCSLCNPCCPGIYCCI